MGIFDIGLVNTAAVSSSADNKDSGSVVVLLYMRSPNSLFVGTN